MLTKEEQLAEDALDNSFKGSIEVIKNALEEEDLNSIREVVGNITVWSGHLGERPDWLTGFSRALQHAVEKHDIYAKNDVKEKFFTELREAYNTFILKK